MDKLSVAILGSGNIGTDLMVKIHSISSNLEVGALVGIDPHSEGLRRADSLGIVACSNGLEELMGLPQFDDIQIILDATSAKVHIDHYAKLKDTTKQIIDLTPAAIGPFVIPTVNLKQHVSEANVNMVTCGGQATIPIVHAVNRVHQVTYAEIIASISSASAGPGTRANIDEFTQTTSRGIELLGCAKRGKAIIILNPANPPLIMRATIYCLVAGGDASEIQKSVMDGIAEVQQYVPGYRLKQSIQFEEVKDLYLADSKENCSGQKVSVFLEVEGAGHSLPAYAGNLDIMTSAAMVTAQEMAVNMKREFIV